MFTSKIYIRPEGFETQSFECMIGLDENDRLIIYSKDPIPKSKFYEKYANTLKNTGNEIIQSISEINVNEFDELVSEMNDYIQSIINEINKEPKESMNKKTSNNTNEKSSNDTKSHLSIVINGKPCKLHKIHWMEIPSIVEKVKCKDGSIKSEAFNYKGTDDQKNTYLSNNLVDWYRKVDESNISEDIAKVDSVKVNAKMKTNNLNNLNKKNKDHNTTNIDDDTKDPFEDIDMNVTQIEPKMSIGVNDMVNVFVKWMIQQDPINPDKHRPVHYKIICELIQKLYEQFLGISKCLFGDYYYFEVTEVELKKLIHGLIFDNPATKDYFTALNISYAEAKNGCTIKDRYEDTNPKVTFCSRYGGPAWHNDFIDLDALCHNVNREIIKVSTPTAE